MAPAPETVTVITVELPKPHEMGDCPLGTRRIIPIVGSRAEGPLLNGHILIVGADWHVVSKNGVAKLDAQYAIQTEVISRGIRHASTEIADRIAAGEDVPFEDYYMRTAIRLETGAFAYEWINR